jgi:formylglycine-generating enzyme required for sulfatase activity
LGDVDHLYLVACRKAEQSATRRTWWVRASIYTLLVGIIAGLVGWINQALIKEQWLWWTRQRWFVSANIWPHVLKPNAEQELKPGNNFRECAPRQQNQDYCPDMVVVPAGPFAMGSLRTNKKARPNELPQHPVTIAKPFAVSKFELTFAEWDACIAGGGCGGYKPNDLGWGRREQPVIYVSWDDAQQYVAWLSKMTGKPYRLLTEAEYEYVTRAGKTTEYPWGNDIKLNDAVMANCNGCGSKWDNQQTVPVGSFTADGFVGSFPPNAFGLYDMVGNVWEWVEDCYHPSYEVDTPQGKVDAPADGSVWTRENCNDRVVRGGSWLASPDLLRSADRDRYDSGSRGSALGFRVARTLIGP